MHRNNWLIPAVCSIFLFGCALPHKAKSAKPPAITAQPAAEPEVRSVKSEDGSISGEIVGNLTPDSKFSRLQIGMTMQQVEKLIGRPDNTDSRFTGKHYQPFHLGGDTKRTETFYEKEGQLTFSNILHDSAADTLIRISVDPDANKKLIR